MKYLKKLVGERIYLSPRNPEDYEVMAKWMNDFAVTDYLVRSNKVTSLASEKEFLEKSKDAEAAFVIVTLKEDKPIGVISLEEIKHVQQIAEAGIAIGEEEYRSKGYGTEAMKLLLDYGFNYLNLHNINLGVLDANERAIKCYKKCGFKEYGRRHECEYINGKRYGTIYMEILKDEFTGDYIKNKNI